MIVEFQDEDAVAFNEVMPVLKHYPNFENISLNEEQVISFPRLTLYPEQRKIYHDGQEIYLTTKEYALFCLLVYNNGCVLTYEQIYQKVWGEEPFGRENNAVGCHIRNLREKFSQTSPSTTFNIRCAREIGYCLETEYCPPFTKQTE